MGKTYHVKYKDGSEQASSLTAERGGPGSTKPLGVVLSKGRIVFNFDYKKVDPKIQAEFANALHTYVKFKNGGWEGYQKFHASDVYRGDPVESGVDIIHCSQRKFWEPECPNIDGEDGLNFAGWVKKVTGAPTISLGSVGLALDAISSFSGQDSPPASLDKLRERMEKGEFDLIPVGRAILNDPQWVSKVRENRLDELQNFAPSALGQLV